MKKFNLYIEDYDWLIRVYVGKTCLDTDEIVDALYSIGCRGKQLSQAMSSLSQCKYNTGLTYSYYQEGLSVMVIGVTDTPAQFLNSLTHEIMHQSVHICSMLDLDLTGEEPCYLAGEIARKMYSQVKDFLCCGCHSK